MPCRRKREGKDVEVRARVNILYKKKRAIERAMKARSNGSLYLYGATLLSSEKKGPLLKREKSSRTHRNMLSVTMNM
jgi:hypothetical protein